MDVNAWHKLVKKKKRENRATGNQWIWRTNCKQEKKRKRNRKTEKWKRKKKPQLIFNGIDFYAQCNHTLACMSRFSLLFISIIKPIMYITCNFNICHIAPENRITCKKIRKKKNAKKKTDIERNNREILKKNSIQAKTGAYSSNCISKQIKMNREKMQDKQSEPLWFGFIPWFVIAWSVTIVLGE